MMRKAAGVQTPVVEIKEEDGTFTIRTETTFKTQEIKFKLGEEFEESRLDGVTVKSKIEQDGNKLVQQQFGEPACEIIREVDGDILKTVSWPCQGVYFEPSRTDVLISHSALLAGLHHR